MKTTQSLITTNVRILIAVGLTCLLAGCTAPNGKLAGTEDTWALEHLRLSVLRLPGRAIPASRIIVRSLRAPAHSDQVTDRIGQALATMAFRR